MPVKPDPSLVVPDELGRVHFIGIGGSGMSGIAHLLLDAGVEVSGSDRAESAYLEGLRARGARIAVGHAAENLGDADTVVFTSAIWPENPEYTTARERGLVLLHRSQALHWLSRRSRVVSVAGAHGKSTTTGMIATALRGLGADPSFVSGAVVTALGTSAASGSGDVFVLEADESDGSFLFYDTAIAVVTNVDPVHLDHYGSADGYLDAFAAFVAGASEYVVAGEGPAVDEVLARAATGVPVLRFGEGPDADLRVGAVAAGDSVAFDLTWRGETRPVRLGVVGRHSAVNAAGAVAALVALGHPFDAAIAAVEQFGGTKRRFEFRGEVRGVRVFDDYAHEPAEVEAAVEGARTIVGDGRVIAIHQPHLYSRTRIFAAEFAAAYESRADLTIVLAVDGAREDPEPGVSGQLVVDHFVDKSKVVLLEDWQEAADHMAAVARAGDIVMTLSCGTVSQIIPQLLDALGRTDEPARVVP